MALYTQKKDITVHVDPISFTANIEISRGYIKQMYEKSLKEFDPDRRVCPCTLVPKITVQDPHGVLDILPEIESCEWYEGDILITNSAEYVISEAGQPVHSLTVYKNIEADSSVEIRAIFKFVDERRNKIVTVERSMTLHTALYDSQVFSIKLTDQPKNWLIDPLSITENLNQQWLNTISAQLFSGVMEIEDAHAAYWWQIYDEQTREWRYLTEDEIDTLVFGRNEDGTWGKSIQFDARYVRNASFRCIAEYFAAERPTLPSSFKLSISTSVKVELPKTLTVDVRQTAGARIELTMDNPVSFECLIFDNRGPIPDDKYHLFRIEWIAKSYKPGVPEKVFAHGRTVTFYPNSFGFDVNYEISIYARVKSYEVMAVMTTTENQGITNRSKLIAAPIYQ